MAIVRKDKLLAGYNGNLESVIVYDNAGENPVKITNGVFVVLEGLIDGERETHKARLAGAEDVGKDILFVHNSEIMYDERLHKLKDFVIEAGKVARAYRLFDGDIVTLTTDLFNGAVAVKDILGASKDGHIGKVAEGVTPKVALTVIEDSGYELDPEMGAFAVKVSRN